MNSQNNAHAGEFKTVVVGFIRAVSKAVVLPFWQESFASPLLPSQA